MIIQVLEFGIGLAVSGVAFADAFSTILVPGPNRGRLKIATRARQLSLPIARRFSRSNSRNPGQRPGNGFAPLVFFIAFAAWLLLLMAGFALMFHAAAAEFSPPLRDFSQALYVAGSSLMTLGVSEVNALGFARWLILAASVAGFGTVTAAFTFIMQVQNGLHQRETGVLALGGMAGSPPSGIALLETFAQVDLRSQLPLFFWEWRSWSAAVLHSHVSFPVLVYFHSVDAESDWLAAFEAVLDASAIIMALAEDEATGAATLMHRAGSRTAAHLCETFGLNPRKTAELPTTALEPELIERLKRAGYRIKPDRDAATAHLLKLRSDYATRLTSLSRHLGSDRAALTPGADDETAPPEGQP